MVHDVNAKPGIVRHRARSPKTTENRSRKNCNALFCVGTSTSSSSNSRATTKHSSTARSTSHTLKYIDNIPRLRVARTKHHDPPLPRARLRGASTPTAQNGFCHDSKRCFAAPRCVV
eukprot:8220753-Lingulodinium_polyedra.AAC.1